MDKEKNAGSEKPVDSKKADAVKPLEGDNRMLAEAILHIASKVLDNMQMKEFETYFPEITKR